MIPEDYIENAVKTESVDWEKIESRTIHNLRLLHAALGIANEGGEVAGVIKKALFYNKGCTSDELRKNFMDECGDVLWYMAIAFDELDLTFEEVMDYNADKLKARYGGGAFDPKKVGGK